MKDYHPHSWLDFLYMLIFSIILPLSILIAINDLFQLNKNNSIMNLSGLLIISLIIFFSILTYYIRQYKLIFSYAVEVGYPHFKPSLKDLILGLYGSIFSVLILVIAVLLFLIPRFKLNELMIFELFIFAIIISTLYQLLSILIMTISKRNLLSTSMESLDSSLLERIKNIPGSEKISEFRYADIKPASLFLSAGVTKYNGRKNICLISRYFQWKLTADELVAVLSHEVGHVHNNDLAIGYILLAYNYFVRTIYYASILLTFSFFQFPLESSISLLILALNMLSSLVMRYLLNYRMFIQEIKADFYGATIVGNYVMANTLKKMPSAIPAPVNDDPLEFLGFRVAILNNRAKNTGETFPTPTRSISRFSNN